MGVEFLEEFGGTGAGAEVAGENCGYLCWREVGAGRLRG